MKGREEEENVKRKDRRSEEGEKKDKSLKENIRKKGLKEKV